MFKRNLTLMLIGALLFSFSAAPTTLAKSKTEKEIEFAAKVKAGITKLGTGPEATLTVKLRDKTKLTGYVSRVGEDSFVIADARTGSTTEVAYPNVTQAKGHNLSTGATIAIAVGVAVGVTLLVLYLLVRASN